ncbi:MAG: hypothetical protein HFJ29_03735 [Clostridia bacterium]|nr:hypothetical protein [Clostridia bacterium]
MDKNILEEYQNRVENVRKTLEENQKIIEEGVEASQSRTDNRLEELQNMLEETQRPIDMSDVGIGVTGSFTRDSRASTIRDSYSNDREGYLLSEYDKRRVDPNEPNINVERIVEEIRRVREAKRMAQEEAIRAEMQDLIDEQARIEDVREAQGEKAQLAIALQEEKDRIEIDIQTKKDRIKEERQKSDKSLEEVELHKKTLALYSDKDSKVYMAAKGEVKRCREKARRARTRAGRLEAEIASLDQDLETLNALLYEVDGRRDEEIRIQRETAERERRETEEQARQEDEMWEAYRAEQARVEEKKEENINYGIAKHNLEQRRAEEREKVNEEKAKASEAKIIEQYADGLNPEEDLSKYDNWKPSTTAKPQQTQPPKPNPPKPQPPKPDPKKDPQPKSDPKQGKWKIESVTFTVEGGSKPVYKVLVSNGKEQKEVISDKVAVLDISRDKEEIANLTNKQKIQNVEKYYDKGLAIALQATDKAYGTTGFEEYKRLLKDKEMIRRYPEKYEDCMRINYDFSQLKGKASKEMKHVQKIAKECRIKGVANYQRKLNIFQRIWRSLTSNIRLLKETPLEPNTSTREWMVGEMKNEGERPYELDINELKEYPEFSPEVARQQMENSVATIEEEVHLDEVIDAAREWRKAQQIETTIGKPEGAPKTGKKETEKEL